MPGSEFRVPFCRFVYFFVFSGLRKEVVVSFVDIDAIVGHYCLNFIFIKWTHIVHDVCQ